ncbi:sugar ABC transporter substrate-binding protein [Carboxydochorda subterranea]|uniref:Sugar ABC transporter substrate-binding protein n=1 Tax=Carboxydichorda subterranea TaxID=3109565 RepID=A0ABZ1BYF2_9FIRM|nr:sugar ABC transporter substrate-binding protein [Limnochorda sp. L945t]WRP17610.1 sugar ABC transporter substrate-binding protein [Limnochorda sp. L945t]
MRRVVTLAVTLALLAAGIGVPAAAAPAPTPLRFVWFTDGPDLAAIQKLVAQFNAANPDVRVELSVLPYAQLNQLLLTQAAAGNAPDLARVSEPGRFFQYLLDMRPYLSDRAFRSAFIPSALKAVEGDHGELYGIPHDFTLNGPFVNVTLFKKAGIALPADRCVSWETWGKLAAQVRDATGVPFAMAVDRSGHRLDGFIQSFGGSFFTPDGKGLRITSPETRKGVEAFVRMHQEGIMPLEVWAGGGQGYAAANQYFINGQLPFYLSGNWQVAQFHDNIGDKFEWKAVFNGCEKQYGGMPGGKFIVAFAQTKAPAKVVRLIEFLGSKEAMRQFARESLFLPTRNDLIKEGIEYPYASDVMNTFLKGIPLLPETSYENYNMYFGPVANEVRDRVTQAILGEISVDEALRLAEAKSREIMGIK